MFHLYKAALVDYFTNLASFLNSAIVVKQITVVKPFLLYGSFQLSVFFSCIQSVRFLPYPRTPSPSAFLINSAFSPFLTVEIPCGPTTCILVVSMDPSDTPMFHHLFQFSKKALHRRPKPPGFFRKCVADTLFVQD
jgi:hypothetical protein